MTRLEKVYDTLKEVHLEEYIFDQLDFFCPRHYGLWKGDCPKDLERDCVSCLLMEYREEDFDAERHEEWKASLRK